ncbi:unnamed protein product [Symbiodinium natans]|uniref:Uncharacterized protein n=1 Tax=Symbiodinium natans TaxID=878477 RepID=A0A812L7D0_9DINO|nr:unnamed protein product [Symbiodinium natans]
MPISHGPAEVAVWLVWCFEHCLKPEHREEHRKLQHLAAKLGCKFVCHKKATGFLTWQDKDGRNGAKLIVADWRETKPIIQGISKSQQPCDVSMCVVARSRKMLYHAALFADTQSAGVEILVTPGVSSESMEQFFSSHLQTACKTSPSMPSPVQPKPFEPLCWTSLPSLLQAVKDPKTVAMLEQLIQQTMSSQVYED